jgi:TatD DNase family protein
VTKPFNVPPLAHPVVDTHCHMDVSFDDEHILPDVGEALANAAKVGVTKVIQVGCDVTSSQWAADTAAKWPEVFATVALHPNAAAHDPDLTNSLVEIDRLAALPQVRGIGETGLDYYRTEKNQAEAQHISFRAHIDMAIKHNKPVIIHDRDAHEDVIETLLTYGAPETVVFHCYSGDAAMAKVCAEQGWYLSFAGTVTFKNAKNLHEAVKVVPDNLLLVETDSPFLTPTPYRGSPNTSAHVALTVREICALRGQSEEDICKLVFSNAARVFGPF